MRQAWPDPPRCRCTMAEVIRNGQALLMRRPLASDHSLKVQAPGLIDPVAATSGSALAAVLLCPCCACEQPNPCAR